uniref:Uncharacterized protein n=2 Tax=Isometrus maculatus TaxID=497827 RepID=A0A0U1SKA1_ISOMC|nr:hypothetical protein [Isometrus maculatus]
MRKVSVILTIFVLISLREYAASSPLHQANEMQKRAKMALFNTKLNNYNEAARSFIKSHLKNAVRFAPSKMEDDRRILPDKDNGRGFMVFRTYDDYGHYIPW